MALKLGNVVESEHLDQWARARATRGGSRLGKTTSHLQHLFVLHICRAPNYYGIYSNDKQLY